MIRASAILLFLASMVLPVSALAHEYSSRSFTVYHPWATATPPGVTTAAAYMKIINKSKRSLRLIAITTPVADKVEVHSMTMDKGIMRMRPVALPLSIKPKGTLELNHEGLHLMLIGLKRPLVEEEMVSARLLFSGGVVMDIDLYVEAPGAAASTHGH